MVEKIKMIPKTDVILRFFVLAVLPRGLMGQRRSLTDRENFCASYH